MPACGGRLFKRPFFVSGQPEGGRAKGVGGQRRLPARFGIRHQPGDLSARGLEEYNATGHRHVRTGRRTQSGHRARHVRRQILARPCDIGVQLGNTRLPTRSRKPNTLANR